MHLRRLPAGLLRTAPALLVVALAVLPAPLPAQAVRGFVVSGTPMAPVAGVFVLLVDTAGTVSRAGVSDSTGAYALLAPVAGIYTLQVQSGGYGPFLSDPFPLPRGQTLQLDLHVPRRIYTLPAVTIAGEAGAPAGVLSGFYERLDRGWGIFFTRDEIQKRGARRISDLLHGLPDVRVIRRSDIESTVRFGTELARVNVGPLSLGEDGAHQIVGDSPLRCSPLLYVDGIKFGRADEVLDQVGPTDIEGIEIYRRATEVPPEFGGLYARCGVILVWTRRPVLKN